MTPLILQPFAHGGHFRGFGLRDPSQQPLLDPFLSVDHFWMSEPTFAPHPHAGFSAVTYLFDDSETGFVNRDSLGHVLDIAPGSLHWTRAAAGVLHDEAPKRPGRTAHGLQVFVNLPAADKHEEPGIAHVTQAEMPEWRIGDARARLAFGTFEGRASPLVPSSQATLVDLDLSAGGTARLVIPPGLQAFVLVVAGGADLDGIPATQELGLASGDSPSERLITVKAPAAARLALFLGRPLREPVVWGGPFVMTSVEDIAQARRDFAGGKMGRLE